MRYFVAGLMVLGLLAVLASPGTSGPEDRFTVRERAAMLRAESIPYQTRIAVALDAYEIEGLLLAGARVSDKDAELLDALDYHPFAKPSKDEREALMRLEMSVREGQSVTAVREALDALRVAQKAGTPATK